MKRSGAIDILRAVAILLVLGRHMDAMPFADTSAAWRVAHKISTLWIRGGWVGVDLFFVLSGFLVSGLLFRDHQKFGTLSGKNFLIRRGFKIYPAYWMLLAVTAVCSLIGHTFHYRALLCQLLFLQNYQAMIWGHTWSLAVEEHFYLLLLLVLAWLARHPSPNPFRLLPHIFAGLAAVCLILRFITAYRVPYGHMTHSFPTHLRIDSLFCGVLVSYYYHYHSEPFIAFARRHRIVLMLGGVLALLPAFVYPLEGTPFIYTVGFTLFYVASAAILISAVTFDVRKGTILAGLAYIGTYSYSIYLWHFPLVSWIMPAAKQFFHLHWHAGTGCAIYFSGSLLLGIGMAFLVEMPLLKLRDRWYPSKACPLDTSGAASMGGTLVPAVGPAA